LPQKEQYNNLLLLSPSVGVSDIQLPHFITLATKTIGGYFNTL